MDTMVKIQAEEMVKIQAEMEKVTNDKGLWNELRNCRAMFVPDDIEQTPCGKFVTLGVEGGGMCMWYYYHSRDGHHMLIFGSHYDDAFHYSGRRIDAVPTSFGIEQYL